MALDDSLLRYSSAALLAAGPGGTVKLSMAHTDRANLSRKENCWERKAGLQREAAGSH